MSDDSQQSNGASNGGPVAGERLAAARRAREVSLHDVAKELHLDEHKVVALEQNRFEILGAPVFAKGYLRKYAELVEVPVDDVIADYYRLNRSSVTPPLITSRPADSAPVFSRALADRPGRSAPCVAAAMVVVRSWR
jgi:cytoskeleton protein RodZ